MLTRLLWRLARENKASALLEFAIALPVLVTLYVGSYVVADIVACNRKVTTAARTTVDLLARGLSPSGVALNPASASATTYMTDATITMTPYGVGNMTENVALLRVCDTTHAYVIWSQAQTQSASGTATSATPILTAGSLSASSVIALPSGFLSNSPSQSPLVPTSPDGSDVCSNYAASTTTKTQVGTAGGYIYVAEVDYTYVPALPIGLPATVPLSSVIYMIPRLN
jgi:Flp pilus assembly protein TadG